MQYKQLQAFMASVQKGSFSQAAQSLSISQPSISRLIKDLQEDLGFELFKKNKGRMIPTPEGMAFYDEVRSVFNGIHHLEKFAENLRYSTHGSLTIGATPALATLLTPRLIQHFIQQYPKVHINLWVDSVDHLTQGLAQSKYDLIITNKMDVASDFIEEPLLSTSWVCVLPRSHRLAHQEVVTPNDLQGENLLSLVDEDGLEWHRHKQLIKSFDLHVNEQFSTQRAMSGYGMVAAGLCIAILDPLNVDLWQGLDIVVKPFRPVVQYDYSIYYLKNRVRSELSRAFSLTAKKMIERDPLMHRDDIR
ncbi:LysR family transcriptional regulator [Terasakiispira papahanaumokuakeensis]|uniref:LysR family transcriptional regulator n=1 Tax=Terasakiispira papahanaumokuakeensis TaxID=197479 RepID=A0A1E2VD85_9GAMM|nr:LysR family transcriptional regulator [Terasakiispira papahanaumokuakeensis]ODC04776.1 LysR family transcriptional regulator [Terasakiispira papahanaumokuakeensis]